MDDSSANLELLLRIALAPGVGPKIAHRLLDHFGSPSAVLAASTAELEGLSAGRPTRIQDKVRKIRSEEVRQSALLELELAAEHQVKLIPWGSAEYPRHLRDLEAPPLILYVRGSLFPTDALALSVVGPRDPSDYARQCVRAIVPPLCAQGITIVSGLARGIDSEAHQAALDSGGRTIAVLAHGLAMPTSPSSSRSIAERIVREDRGALVSIFPLEVNSLPHNFSVRNEIIAALAPGVLVPEASEKSGALITAGRALELGRTVMALPGDITRSGAEGSNQLLAEGATLIRKSDDVLQALSSEFRDALTGISESADGSRAPSMKSGQASSDAGRLAPGTEAGEPAPAPQAELGPEPGSGDPIELTIRSALHGEHRPIDFILGECSKEGFDHSSVVQRLLEMEMAGSIRQLPGKIFARAV